MNIIETNFKFKTALSNRSKTEYIILHHLAGNGDASYVHNLHLSWDYAGIGYHYYIRKNGSIYAGRPRESIGAHCPNYNNKSVGISFEGNYENETMCQKQLEAGLELIHYLKGIYPSASVIRHKDVYATLCPGKNFPFKELSSDFSVKKELTSPQDIIEALRNEKHKIEINEVERAVKSLEEAKAQNSSLYWILYKIVNKE